jgi:hypothetical protein
MGKYWFKRGVYFSHSKTSNMKRSVADSGEYPYEQYLEQMVARSESNRAKMMRRKHRYGLRGLDGKSCFCDDVTISMEVFIKALVQKRHYNCPVFEDHQRRCHERVLMFISNNPPGLGILPFESFCTSLIAIDEKRATRVETWQNIETIISELDVFDAPTFERRSTKARCFFGILWHCIDVFDSHNRNLPGLKGGIGDFLKRDKRINPFYVKKISNQKDVSKFTNLPLFFASTSIFVRDGLQLDGNFNAVRLLLIEGTNRMGSSLGDLLSVFSAMVNLKVICFSLGNNSCNKSVHETNPMFRTLALYLFDRKNASSNLRFFLRARFRHTCKRCDKYELTLATLFDLRKFWNFEELAIRMMDIHGHAKIATEFREHVELGKAKGAIRILLPQPIEEEMRPHLIHIALKKQVQ